MAKKAYVRNSENTEWVELASATTDLSAYLTNSSASSTYLTQASASNIYLTQNSASTTYATKTELNNIDLSSASAAAVSAIVDSAPETLNTLNELAAALGDDANYASTITTALGNKLDISSASTTYATKTELNNIDALPSQSGNGGKYLTTSGSVASWGTLDLSTYAPIVDPVFTDDIQVDGQINLAMSGSVATSYISSFDDFFAGGPSTKLLGRYVQVETDVVDDQFSRISLQPGIISIVASGESSYVALSGASGQYINSFDPANQIATIGNLSSINGESDQFILPGQIFG